MAKMALWATSQFSIAPELHNYHANVYAQLLYNNYDESCRLTRDCEA